ncbi:hypothetical protein HAX54_004928 [Datura stramonium]|uniref:Uncharacterized protein n=1 Tax=Datura stramonium TaxID=4076 RepID=A0ABS8T8W0_DATST|nr:hypothetical protein [Datura stramonium]
MPAPVCCDRLPHRTLPLNHLHIHPTNNPTDFGCFEAARALFRFTWGWVASGWRARVQPPLVLKYPLRFQEIICRGRLCQLVFSGANVFLMKCYVMDGIALVNRTKGDFSCILFLCAMLRNRRTVELMRYGARWACEWMPKVVAGSDLYAFLLHGRSLFVGFGSQCNHLCWPTPSINGRNKGQAADIYNILTSSRKNGSSGMVNGLQSRPNLVVDIGHGVLKDSTSN